LEKLYIIHIQCENVSEHLNDPIPIVYTFVYDESSFQAILKGQ